MEMYIWVRIAPQIALSPYFARLLNTVWLMLCYTASLGHALNKILKDIIIRYKVLQGYKVQ
jgi:hypothetical protein